MLTGNVPDVICTFDSDADDSEDKSRCFWALMSFLKEFREADYYIDIMYTQTHVIISCR